MKLFDETKSILENLYLLSGPIIALLGLFIFKQIKLAKGQLTIAKGQLEEAQKQLLISSKRDSIKLAAEQVHYYLNTIVGFQDVLNDQLKEADINPLKITTYEFNYKDIFKQYDAQVVRNYHEKLSPHLVKYLKVLNSMETFSTYFIQEVADENVAFEAVGATFCYSVNNYSFVLCILSKLEHETFFCNTIKLYNIWSKRLEKKGIQYKKQNLEKEFTDKINKINEELKNKGDESIIPLGSK
ncbi:MAG: hypothetical protein WC615_16225 [Mucilaginibacter sp.]|jgi:hypothetical protein|uniref:hypothetical protein n=1 Tax=Mucilaginibacter sp. TaxID=1882438 RepID=UPI00356AEF8E